MTASIRFIGLAVFCWAGVRAVSLGMVPGSEALAIDRGAAAAVPTALPPLEQTQFAPIDPVAPTADAPTEQSVELMPARADATVMLPAARPMRTGYAYPVYVPVPGYAPAAWRDGQSSPDARLAYAEADLPPPRRLFGSAPMTTDLPPARQLAAALPQRSAGIPAADATVPPPLRRRRLELSSWALMRGKPGDLLGANSLSAANPTLGGSQAGARISYWATPNLAASLRSSTPLGGARGGEVAAGVRYQPWRNLPLSFTAERRQRFGRAGGRNDFALFAEGGVWDRPMPCGFRLDGYAQAGIVGIKSRDLFGDGAFTMTRPLFRNIWEVLACGAERSRVSTGSTQGRA